MQASLSVSLFGCASVSHTPLDPGWPRVRLQAYKVIEQCRIVAFSVNVCYLRRHGFIGPAVCVPRLAAASRVKSAW
jgi:hypothetical protein